MLYVLKNPLERRSSNDEVQKTKFEWRMMIEEGKGWKKILRSDEAICQLHTEYQIDGLSWALRKAMKDCFTSFAKSVYLLNFIEKNDKLCLQIADCRLKIADLKMQSIMKLAIFKPKTLNLAPLGRGDLMNEVSKFRYI